MISIRTANKEDKDALAELYTELEKDGVLYQPEHFIISEKGSRIFDGMFDSEDQRMIVAEDDGEVIGFIHVKMFMAKDIPCLKPQKNLYICDLVVNGKCRSKGVGTMLMDAAKEYGKENGAEFVRTQVFPMNEGGLRFYARNGFSEKMVTVECPL